MSDAKTATAILNAMVGATSGTVQISSTPGEAKGLTITILKYRA